MKVDFKYLKTEVSLPDLFIALGWNIADGCSRSSPKFTDGNQTVVVKKNKSGEYTYWDVHNHSDCGKNILDLMTRYIYDTTGKMPSLREAGEAVQKYADDMATITPQSSKFSVSNSNLSSSELVALSHELKIYDSNFLEKRGITQKTLTSPVFSDVFYSRKYTYKGKNYNNTCVKMENTEGFKGISQRGFDENNKSFKGIKGYKFGSIALSKYDKNRPLDFIFVGESMIDNASHYQIKYLNDNKNVLYISTEGNITQGQIELIHLLLTTQISKNNINSINQVIYIFDNDPNGHRYALKLDGYLKEQKIPDIENLSTEELREKVIQLPNIDLSTNSDWNDDLQIIQLKEKEIKFQEAIKKNDFSMLIKLKDEGFQPSTELFKSLGSVDNNTMIAVQKIYELKQETSYLETLVQSDKNNQSQAILQNI